MDHDQPPTTAEPVTVVVGRPAVIRYLHGQGQSASECAAVLGITTAEVLDVLEREDP